MKLKIDDLGVVGVIVDDWSFEKDFKPKTIVTDYTNWKTYISRRAVPSHIHLTDTYYWKPILKPFGGGSLEIDDHLDKESVNPVQNKVITEALENIEEPSEYIKDASVSTDGNTLTLTKKDGNTVTFTPEGGGSIDIDDVISSTSENPVQNKIIKNAIDGEKNRARIAEEQLDLSKQNKSTTLGGYGILDAYTKEQTEAIISAGVKEEEDRAKDAEANLEYTKANKAYTLEGYGINDAYTKQATDTKINEEHYRASEEEESLRRLYEALIQSNCIIVEEEDWPISNPQPNTIYRVTGTSSYTDYMYNANDLTNPKKMAEYDNAIDDEPTLNSNNLVKSGGVSNFYGYKDSNPEFLKVTTDKDGRILIGIKKNGDVIFGAGIPEQIKKWVLENVGNIIDALNSKVDKVEEKSLIDATFASAARSYASPDISAAFLDKKGRIIISVDNAGQVSIPKLVNPKITDLFTKISEIELQLQVQYKGAGTYVEQKKHALTVFKNTEAGCTYFRKDGNIWLDDNNRSVVINPITDYDAADPSYIKVGDYFYLFKTGKHCVIDRSKDLVNWERNYSQVFPDDFDYSIFPNFSNAWANDINYIDGRYVDYIAIWAGNSYDSYTIVMYANSIEGPWTYGGIMCPSMNSGGPCVSPIDPEYVSDGVNGYLIVGSFTDLWMAQVSADGLHTTGNWVKIARGVYGPDIDFETVGRNHCGEGAYVYKYKGYYYLFTSLGNYRDYRYRVGIARAQTLGANFVNKNGENLLDGDVSVILYSDEGDTLYGPGHNGEIYTDANGDMYMILHCHAQGVFSYEGTRPAFIMRIVEGDDGWLAFADMDGNVVTKPTWTSGTPNI